MSRKPATARASSGADSFEAAASLREALRLFSRRSEEVTRRHGLSPRGYSLLLMIKTGREHERATPDELERRLQLAKRVLTSGVKRVDNGVYAVAKQDQQGKFKGGTDLVFNLKNGGMGIGKINPSVPASYIKLMNRYRTKIISGKLKVPSAIK